MAQAPTPAADAPTKSWRSSLTMQGAMIAGAAPLLLQYGPMLLHFAGIDPAQAADLAHGVSTVLTDVGALMAVIGRSRLGGLH